MRRNGCSACVGIRNAQPERAKRPYKLAYGEPGESAQSDFTYPDSRIMTTRTEGFQQYYNARAVMDGESQLVVGMEVTDNTSDGGRLVELVDDVAGACGEVAGEVLADAGYCSETELEELDARRIEGDEALGGKGKAAASSSPESCPAKARMSERLSTPEGRAVHAKRQWIAEAPFDWIKEAMGFPRFSVWGLEKLPWRMGSRVFVPQPST